MTLFGFFSVIYSFFQYAIFADTTNGDFSNAVTLGFSGTYSSNFADFFCVALTIFFGCFLLFLFVRLFISFLKYLIQ